MNTKMYTSRFLARRPSRLLSALLASALAACSTPKWAELSTAQLPERNRTLASDTQPITTDEKQEARFFQTPQAPQRTVPQIQTVAPYKQPNEPGKEATVAFDSMPLPQFINAVFGVILKKTITIDPQVQQRRDLVSMRAGKPQTPSQLYESAKTVLRAYGITVQELPGVTRFVLDNADAGSLPEIRRGRALPEVPETLRPLFYLAELENTQSVQAVNWLRTAFKDKITVQEDTPRNAVMLSGSPQNINAAMQALIALDQPLMRGRISARIVPTFWSADELTKRLSEILSAEGYFNGIQPGSAAPVVMLPVPPVNSVMVFANNQALLDHIMRWAEELDQPSQSRTGGYFTYNVRHTDAADLATTLGQVLGGGGSTSTATTSGTTTGTTAARSTSGRIVVNKATNSLILQASSTEYQQWISLLRELDRPAKSALISVSVAEVQLTDSEQFGFEWLVNKLRIGGLEGTLSTIGSFSTSGIGGLALSLGGSSPSVILNAIASSNDVRVLSNPSILTRSGEEATVSVGKEVPIITSQQNNSTTTTATTILQTVQYRNTGTILKVKPVVRAGGRIDLSISQEVSDAVQNTTGSIQSPIITNSKIDTKLTTRDGNTIVLGGLVKNTLTDNNSGVPLAKDIPFLGRAFKSTTNKNERSELVILITAYAVEDDFDVESITDAFRKRFPWTSPLYKSTPLPKEGDTALLKHAQNKPAAISKPYVRPTTSEDVMFSAGARTGSQPLLNANTHMRSDMPASTVQPANQPPKGATPATGNGAKGRPVSDEALKQELLKALQVQ